MASNRCISYKRIRPTQQQFSSRGFLYLGSKISEQSFATRRLESLRQFHSHHSTIQNSNDRRRRALSEMVRFHSSEKNRNRNRQHTSRRNNFRPEATSSHNDRFQNEIHRRDSKPSPATLLMDQWEQPPSTSSYNQSSYKDVNVQRKRFEERQEALCRAIVQYRNIWFEPDDTNIATEWKHAVQFQHPTIGTKDKLLETEELFGQICTLCHDFFVTTALLAESDLYPTKELSAKQKQGLSRQLQQQQEAIDVLSAVLPFWETLRKDRTTLVQQAWKQEPPEDEEQIAKNLQSQLEVTATPVKEEPRNWVSWIKSMVIGSDKDDDEKETVEVPKKLGLSSLTAHDDVQFAPNHYHYNKLVGRLYFSYPPLVAFQAFQDEDDDSGQELLDVQDADDDDGDDDDDEDYEETNGSRKSPETKMPSDQDSKLAAILEQRANQLQRIFDQVPNTVPPGKGGMMVRSPILTDKMVRLLIRAYQDTGTLDAAYKTEQVFYKYPSHRRGLLWYVLMSYLQVTEKGPSPSASASSDTSGDNSDTVAMGFAQKKRQIPKKFSPKSASLATKRVCELLSKQVKQSSMNPNELHSCATIGFQCLANIAVPSLDRYYDRVHALATLKFGTKTWEALLSQKPNMEILQQQLRPKDPVSIQLLIQIYAKSDGTMVEMEDVHMEKAKALLDNMWKCYSISELQDSIERSTFHSILDALNKRRKRKKKNRDEEPDSSVTGGDPTVFDNQEDFDYALTLFDKMMAHEVWYPNEETFHYLYRLAEYGPQADEVSVRLELCRAILQEYPISPYLASKHALRAWSDTAERGALLWDDSERTVVDEEEKASIAMERAYQIFQQLQMYSSPLLYHNAPQKISHVYNINDKPTSLYYGLVWQTCYYTAQNASAATKRRAVEIATSLYRQQQQLGMELRPKSYRMFLQCLSWSTNDEERLELAQDVLEKARQSTTSGGLMEPLLLEALLDCLVHVQTNTTQRQELIQQVYNEVVSTHDMPVMSDRFLALLGRVHPELHKRHIADQQQKKKQ